MKAEGTEAKKGKSGWRIFGISELSCWLGHKNPTFESSSGRDAEDCIDAHMDCGIRHIAWDLGRSVLNYHSDLPGATCRGLRVLDGKLSTRDTMIEGLYRGRCQLRAALRHARGRNMVVYGRLCMNRHYSPSARPRIHRSDFAQDNPCFCEVRRDGWIDPSRLCFGIPGYREERVAILAESLEIGVDGIQLDFCRQPPMVLYHPVFVNGFEKETGLDPRRITPEQGDEYLRWCAFRADAVTAFMRELAGVVRAFRDKWMRPAPVQARIPNDGFEANLIAGLDVRAWCREGLIDELALSELRWLPGYTGWDDNLYIELGGKHNIPVFASSSCLPWQGAKWKDGSHWGGQVNPRGINPLVLARRALKSCEAGASGISLYQSDTGIQRPEMKDVVTAMADSGTLREYIEKMESSGRYPVSPENADFGIDNHSLEF